MNKTTILLTTIIRQRPGVLAKDVRGSIYVFDAATQKIYSLNETASFIWKLARISITVKMIIGRMCDEFEVSKYEATEDATIFIKNFTRLGFIKIV